MKDILGIDPAGKSTAEKMAILENTAKSNMKILDAVYERRGWTKNGVPKIQHLKDLGMDLPELIEVITPLQD
jgi:aldehyde:ferredoxin oxidoreductase